PGAQGAGRPALAAFGPRPPDPPGPSPGGQQAPQPAADRPLSPDPAAPGSRLPLAPGPGRALPHPGSLTPDRHGIGQRGVERPLRGNGPGGLLRHPGPGQAPPRTPLGLPPPSRLL